MRSMLFAALLSAFVPFAALAQTADDLKNDENTAGDVLVYGMGCSANRFSPLTQTKKENVSKLVPVWAYSLADPNVRGYLKAVDPLTGKSKWETPYKSPNYSSTMVTASNLVFTGVMTGEFQALDADTGKVLWSFQTPSGIIGQPVTWGRNGKQYVTVMSGIGGVYTQRGGDPNLANLPTGVSLWTFALFDK